MKYTADDFADEARDHELFELDLADGTTVTPRSRWGFSYEEDAEEIANRARWEQWHQDNPGKVAPDDAEVDDHRIYSPDEWLFRTRLGDQYDAWWSEWKSKPLRQIVKLFQKVDEHYDPSPASDQEKDAASAGDPAAAGKSGSDATS